jgi:hypothetical protein
MMTKTATYAARIATAKSLDDLLSIIKEIAEEKRAIRSEPDACAHERAEDVGREVDWCSLPTFGGADLSGTPGAWSWDATRVISGTCPEDMRIVEREDESDETTDEEPTPRTITAAAEGYSVALTGDAVDICRESGEWVGNGRWENGRIVDCSANLADDPDESERIYDALETAIQDELDEAERLEAERLEAEAEARYIVVQAPSYDGGLMVARIATGETEDQCARRCGAVIRSYGPYERGGE